MLTLSVPLPDDTYWYPYDAVPCWAEILQLRCLAWEHEGSLDENLRTPESWWGRHDRRAIHWIQVRDGRLIASAQHAIYQRQDESPDAENYRKGNIPPIKERFASINRLVVHPEWQKRLRKDSPFISLPTEIVGHIEHRGYPRLIIAVGTEVTVRIATEKLHFQTVGEQFLNPFFTTTGPGSLQPDQNKSPNKPRWCQVVQKELGPLMKGPNSCRW